MPTHKQLADFLSITESGVKYKKKNKPAEYILLSLGYKYLHQMSSFDKFPIITKLETMKNKAKLHKQ